MQPIAFVTGADRGLGLALSTRLIDMGWYVIAGQFMPEWPELSILQKEHPQDLLIVPLDVASIESAKAAAEAVKQKVDHIDLVINNAGVTSPTMVQAIHDGLDYAEIHRMYNINALGPLRVIEALISLTDKSSMKRLCFVSSEAGSIEKASRNAWFGYCMSKAALNMAVKILFNDLRPQGYTFRVYHPGWMRSYMGGKKNNEATLEPEEAAVPALAYFLGEGEIQLENPVQCNEDQLVLRDYQGNDWPW
jgi:NAD(P)-dependent dehydrogenase (short-subunit alcohol dehydrogenase family)